MMFTITALLEAAKNQAVRVEVPWGTGERRWIDVFWVRVLNEKHVWVYREMLQFEDEIPIKNFKTSTLGSFVEKGWAKW